MNANITPLQHPDFIWTWKESARGQRQSIWIPYLKSIQKLSGKGHWQIAFNGGECSVDLAKTDLILLYGATSDIPVEFLDDLNAYRICLSIHRRNMPRPYVFMPAGGADEDDLLTAQISARLNAKTCAYIARTLIRESFIARQSWLTISETEFKRLAAARNVADVRQIEAAVAARYWPAYFQSLGLVDPPTARRDCPHPVNTALDAGSFFLHGVLLRWILFHKFSPYHGFLHQPTTYPALVYDLIEPYRHWIEIAVAKAAAEVGADDADRLVAATIAALKQHMEGQAYIPATRQAVRRKSLLHGIVLALRAWLLGKQTRIVLPVEGERRGGRPPRVAFSMPGYRLPENK